jgi:hypothetical protein
MIGPSRPSVFGAGSTVTTHITVRTAA